jgi:hypothetical protein
LTTPEEVSDLFRSEIPRATNAWKRKRILLYAHGGLVSEKAAIQRLSEYRTALLDAEVYPISFIWRTDYKTTVTNMISDAIRGRRPEGFLDSAKDLLLDRIDDGLEPLARAATGRAVWKEMKENAVLATTSPVGGARLAAKEIAGLAKKDKIEFHVLAPSAGSIFMAPLVQILSTRGKIPSRPLKGASGYGLPIETLTLWAPACTPDFFRTFYQAANDSEAIRRIALYTLTDEAEQDDNCAGIYHKSLLYLVSHAFEDDARIPIVRPKGTPILGMERAIKADDDRREFFANHNRCDWVRSPNDQPAGSLGRSTARHHGDFDDDLPTVTGTLQRIVGESRREFPNLRFARSQNSMEERRLRVSGMQLRR